jgi:hypothetical protein
MPYIALFLLLGFLGLMGFFFVAIVAASLWEKRPIQPYYVPAAGEEYEPSSVAATANRQAAAVGFRHVVACHDGKGKLYRVRYDFWVDPNNAIFAVIGSGTIAKMAVNGASLYSRMADGRVVTTTNYAGEQDISGIEEQVTWPQMPFGALYVKHTERFNEIAVEPFKSESALAEYFDIRRYKADALVARGYAYYLDGDRKVWRYNLKGAMAFYFTSTWVRPFRRFLRSVGLARG